jgi:hypothetical protein
MYEIEFDQPEINECQCCGAEQEILTRFVARDGAPFAIYKAVLTKGGHEPRADVVIGIGDWTRRAGSGSRSAFFCHIWADEDRYNVNIVDAAQSAWASSDLFGVRLDRNQALKHPALPALFELSDHIVQADAALANYLDRKDGISTSS